MSATKPLPNILGGMPPGDFLARYWQKQAHLFRQALPGYQCPLSANELAGLALEPEVESRIIFEQGRQGPWELHKGPFDETFLQNLPHSHWTLLIQQLDAWHPEIASLLNRFDFIPKWRIDDVMASFAPAGGSVGPHVDQYDVFLVQAQGQRHWQIADKTQANTARVANTELDILQRMEVSQEWTLNPGDMLYLPPGVPHWGVAQDDCITLSIGFRSPNRLDLFNYVSDLMTEQASTEVLFTDPNLAVQQHPGEITREALKNVKRFLAQALEDEHTLAMALGELSTHAKNEAALDVPENPISRQEFEASKQAGELCLAVNEGSKFAYFIEHSSIMLFADGQHFTLPLSELHVQAVQSICQPMQAPPFVIPKACLQSESLTSLWLDLLNQGSLYYL